MKEKELAINTEEGTAEEREVTEQPIRPKMTLRNILNALSTAVATGDLSSHQSREMLRGFGIGQSYFTRKIKTPAERKKKRKAQTVARRKNRGKTKGISIRKGQRFTPPKT